MRQLNSGGDVLARGGVRAQFNPLATTTQAQWDAAFADFDAEEFLKKGAKEVEIEESK